MDSPIRPIQNHPIRPTPIVHRRREGETAFHVPETESEPDDRPEDEPASRERDEERRVAAPLDDEAGIRLDITA